MSAAREAEFKSTQRGAWIRLAVGTFITAVIVFLSGLFFDNRTTLRFSDIDGRLNEIDGRMNTEFTKVDDRFAEVRKDLAGIRGDLTDTRKTYATKDDLSTEIDRVDVQIMLIKDAVIPANAPQK